MKKSFKDLLNNLIVFILILLLFISLNMEISFIIIIFCKVSTLYVHDIAPIPLYYLYVYVHLNYKNFANTKMTKINVKSCSKETSSQKICDTFPTVFHVTFEEQIILYVDFSIRETSML